MQNYARVYLKRLTFNLFEIVEELAEVMMEWNFFYMFYKVCLKFHFHVLFNMINQTFFKVIAKK